MNPQSQPSPASEPSEEELLQQCLDRPEGEQLEELERLCRAFPPSAAGLRRRYAMLASHGLVSLPLSPGHRWGPYRLIEEIGRGGMGVVYLAEHVEWKRRVALKFLSPESVGSARAAERFRREIAVLAKLDHPGICPVYEAGEHLGQPFVAMRHVPGRTLAAVIAEAATAGRRLPAAPVLGWFEAIARAVECAHAAGIVHRDLKPANVMLQDDDRPVVLDFGLARDALSGEVALTASQAPVGTPAYMAPEQVGDGAVGPWTDVHALGAMLHECLTLSAAFPGTSRTEVFHRVLHEAPPRLRVLRPDAGRDLELVVGSCLDKDPQRRYARAGALADDLRAVSERRPIRARPLPRWLRAWRWTQRNRAAAVSLAFVTLLAVAATWFGVEQASSDRAMRGRNLVLAAIEASDDSELAALFAEAAYRLQPNAESLDFLRSALFEVHEVARLQRPGATWYEFAFVGEEHLVVAGEAPFCELLRRDGTEIRRLELSGDSTAINVGPDLTIAVAMRRGVRTFDRSGEPLPWPPIAQQSELRGVRSVCWLTERRLLVTRSGGVTIFDRDGAEPVHVELPGLSADAPVVARLAADGSLLVLGSLAAAFVVRVTDGVLGAPEELRGFDGAGSVLALAVDASGRRVLVATSCYLRGSELAGTVKRNEVRWWHHVGGTWQLQRFISDYQGEVMRAVVAPDGQRFAFSTSTGQVWIYAGDGQLLNVSALEPGTVATLAWSNDGRRLAAMTTRGTVHLFDDRGMFTDMLHGGFWTAQFEPDGRHLWTLGTETLQRHRLDQPERLRGHGAALYFAAPTTEHEFVTCGRDPRVVVWRDGQQVRELRDPGATGWLLHATGVDGGVLTVGSDSRVRRFDREGNLTGRPSEQIPGWQSRVLPLPDGRLVVVKAGRPGAVIMAADLRSFVPLEDVPSAWGGDVTADGRWFVVAGIQAPHSVQVWDLRSDPPHMAWTRPIDTSFHLRAVAIGDNGNLVVVGEADGDLTVFDRAAGTQRTWHAHSGPINDVDVAADGRIATASFDRTAGVWNATGERLAHLRGHRLGLWSARFLPSGRHVVTASDDGTARVWPLAAEDVLELARRDLHPEARRGELAAKAALVGELLDRR